MKTALKVLGLCVLLSLFFVFAAGCTNNGNGHVPTEQTYTITYVTLGGSPVSEQSVPLGFPVGSPASVKAGYFFGGWTFEDGTDASSARASTNVTLYAKWVDMLAYRGNGDGTYTVYGNAEGGSGGDFQYIYSYHYAGLDGYVLEIPSSYNGGDVTAIDTLAFQNYSYMLEVNIPSTVKSIGAFAFHICYRLRAYNVQPENTHFYSQDGVLYNHNKSKLAAFPEAKLRGNTFEVPHGVHIIGTGAFSGAGITGVLLPDTLENIEIDAFRSSDLEAINIPASVKTIGNWAFAYCLHLSNVLFAPDSRLESIGAYAFYRAGIMTGVPDFDSIELPQNLKTLSSSAFDETKLHENALAAAENGVAYISGWAVKYTGKIAHVSFRLDTVGIALGFAYASSNDPVPEITSVTIPESVRTINMMAFSGCRDIQSVTIAHGGLIHIGDNAFFGCQSLNGIIIPQSVTVIDKSAFLNCTNLTIYVKGRKERPQGLNGYWHEHWNVCDYQWGYPPYIYIPVQWDV